MYPHGLFSQILEKYRALNIYVVPFKQILLNKTDKRGNRSKWEWVYPVPYPALVLLQASAAWQY